MKKVSKPEIIVYIAMSLDGFIADKKGSVDWLDQFSGEGDNYGYQEFISSIDTVIMGSKSYDKVLEFDIPWPYEDKRSLVVSADPDFKIRTGNTELISILDKERIEGLKTEITCGIWVLGGGRLIRSLLELDSIDKIDLFIMPLILGGGIPLFPGSGRKRSFKACNSKVYSNGVVNIKYVRSENTRLGE